MSVLRTSLAFIFSVAVAGTPMYASHVHRPPTSGQTQRATANTASSHHSSRRTAHRSRGQQAIEPDRVSQIQQALIREHYMSGDANGKWDTATVAAMQKYQSDHGWQTKLMPDSRALKSLGLGPDYSGAINAKNASFTAPPPVSTIPVRQAEGFVAASGVDQ